MGPSQQPNKSTPSRPKFSWDGKDVPWTDGIGSQEKYAEAVQEWSSYHDLLPDHSTLKYPKSVRATILKSQLYGRARYVVRWVTPEQLQSDDGVLHIVNALYKRDTLTVLSDVYSDFYSLITARRGNNESFKNYETRHASLVAKFNSHGFGLQLPEAITAFMLMTSSNIDDNHRVSILAAASNDLSEVKVENQTETMLRSSDTVVVQNVKYESVASILRQCVSKDTHNHISQLSVNQSKFGSGNGNRGNGDRLRKLKRKYPCRVCGKLGHCKDAHNPDGSLKSGVYSYDKPPHSPVDNEDKKAGGSEKNSDKNEHSKPVLVFMSHPASSSFKAYTAGSTLADFRRVGPLVENAAPFSAIGEMELHFISLDLIKPPVLEEKPNELLTYDSWQYGSGDHASQKKSIIGSVNLLIRTDNHNFITVRHLVIQGSSGWVIGRNLTRPCDIQHIGAHALILPDCNGDKIALVDVNFHSYMSIDRFRSESQSSPNVTCLSAASSVVTSETLSDWSKIRRVVDRVHQHTYGHGSFSDMRTLLNRNGLWNEHVQSYLATTVSSCSNCKASSTPPPNRRVSITSLHRAFNDVVCIDHFFIDDVTFFHAMDVASKFSVAHAVSSTGLEECMYALENLWFAQFWPPCSLHADGAFQVPAFIYFLGMYDISLRPVPPRRHAKNMIEPRHGVIRSIYLWLRHADPSTKTSILVVRAVRISNDLYGNDVVFSFELAKGFTRPVENDSQIQAVPEEIIEAHVDLSARRKLNKILRSHNYAQESINVGDMVQVYVKLDKAKRGSWSSPRIVLSIDQEGGFVVVPGRGGRRMSAALEDVRVVPSNEGLSAIVQTAVDELDGYIDDILATLPDKIGDSISKEKATQNESYNSNSDSTNDVCDFSSESVARPNIGGRIEVFWPLDNKYYSGQVSAITEDGMCIVQYDDSEVETLNMAEETWRFEQSTPLQASSLSVLNTLESNEHEIIQEMMDKLGQRPFLWHQAQGFDQSVISKSYLSEEKKYIATVKRVHRKQVRRDSNIVSSHVVYKVKVEDDGSLRLKARIAPHDNEDSDTYNLKSDCCMCSPTGIRVVATVSSICGWRIIKIDVEMAFHQSGPADRYVYVRPPRESSLRNELWLLLVAGYGLVNTNSKWQSVSDDAFLSLGLHHLAVIPQLFLKYDEQGEVMLSVIKIVDDILACGPDDQLRWFTESFGDKFKLGTVSHGPGKLRFYGLWIEQFEDFSCTINADDKLQALDAYPLTRVRRRQFDEDANSIERSAFNSVNSSLSWLGTTASPLCAFYSSHLQQQLPKCKVKSIVSQTNILTSLKKHGTSTHYPRNNDINDIKIVSFADASHSADVTQLCYIIGLVYGPLAETSVFHVLTWASHKSRRPVKSTPAAEILAANESLDELIRVRSAMSEILGVKIAAWQLVDSKDLYTSLTTQRNSVDRSIRGDVNCIRYVFETELDMMGWIKGTCNPVDVGTKPNSSLTNAVVLMLSSGNLNIDLSSCESQSSQRRLG